jgi:hypothetical protein
MSFSRHRSAATAVATPETVAAILDDRELERLTKHLGLPSDLPKTVPAKSRPPPMEGDSCDEDSQVDPRADL